MGNIQPTLKKGLTTIFFCVKKKIKSIFHSYFVLTERFELRSLEAPSNPCDSIITWPLCSFASIITVSYHIYLKIYIYMVTTEDTFRKLLY